MSVTRISVGWQISGWTIALTPLRPPRSCFSFQRNCAKIQRKVRDRTSSCDVHIASIESCKQRSTRVIDAISVREIDRSRDRLAFYLMATRRSMTDGQPAPSRGNNRANAFIVICYDRGNLRGRWRESRFVIPLQKCNAILDARITDD